MNTFLWLTIFYFILSGCLSVRLIYDHISECFQDNRTHWVDQRVGDWTLPSVWQDRLIKCVAFCGVCVMSFATYKSYAYLATVWPQVFSTNLYGWYWVIAPIEVGTLYVVWFIPLACISQGVFEILEGLLSKPIAWAIRIQKWTSAPGRGCKGLFY